MRDRDAHRRPQRGRIQPSWLRALVAAASGTALAWLACSFARDAAPTPVAAQADRVPRALDIQPLSTFGGSFDAVAADGTHVYAMRTDWLEAYGMDDAGGLTFEGRIHVPGVGAPFPYVQLAAQDGRVYVLLSTPITDQGSRTRCAVYDVRPGQLPQLAGEVMIEDIVFQAAAGPGRLYLVGAGGVHVLDVRDAAKPVVLALIAKDGDVAHGTGIAVDGERLFMALVNGSLPRAGRVLAYDVGDGRAPRLDAERDVYGWPHAIAVHRGMVLVWSTPWPPSLANDALTILSAAAPTLDIVAQHDLGERYKVRDAFIVGRHAVALGDRAEATPRPTRFEQVLTFDLDELPAKVTLLDNHDVELRGDETAAVLGNTVWLAARFEGLRALHVDPASGAVRPEMAVRTLGRPGGLATDGRHFFTADDDGELWVLDLKPSGAIETVYGGPLAWPDGRAAGPSGGASLAIAADAVVIAREAAPFDDNGFDDSGDVVIVDVSAPDHPVVRSIWQPDDDPFVGPVGDPDIGMYGPVVDGEHVYVTHPAGLIDLDIQRPDGARARRLLPEPPCAFVLQQPQGRTGCRGLGVALDGDRAFAARGNFGLRMFDIAPDGQGAMADAFPARDARDVALTDRAIFIADGADGLRVYDRLAALTADLTGIFHGLRITLAGDTAFITGPPLGAGSDGSHAIWAIDVADPFRPVLRGHLALPTGSVTGNDWTDPPHALVNEDMILVTVPDRGIAVFRLADGGPLPASRLALPFVAVAR